MNIREQLIRDEGRHLIVYRCPRGKLTIGVGRNLEDRGITHAEALYLLDNDIADFTRELVAVIPWAAPLDDARFGALLNMAFNLGVEGLTDFKKMLLAIRYERWDEAAKELLDSVYARQVGDRARRLARQIETGVWQ